MSKTKLTPNAQRQAALARPREVLRLPRLARVVVGRTHPSMDGEYALILEGGEEITIGRAANLLSQSYMRALVAERAGYVMPRLKPVDWDKLVQLILDICEEVQV